METSEVVEAPIVQAAPVVPSQSAPTPAPASQSAPASASFQTPQEGVPFPYQPWDFTIKIGPDFSKTEGSLIFNYCIFKVIQLKTSH